MARHVNFILQFNLEQQQQRLAQQAQWAKDNPRDDPDSYAPASPAVVQSPRQGTSSHVRTSSEKEGKKVILSGYLMKCASKRKNWRKRYFVLTPDTLIYAKSHLDINNGKAGKNGKVVPLAAVLDALECTVSKHGGLGLGVGVDKGASTMQRVTESAWRWRQAWPLEATQIPRLIIVIIALIVYTPLGGNAPGPNTDRDAFFFSPETGALSDYAFGVMLANLAWITLNSLSVLAAAVWVRMRKNARYQDVSFYSFQMGG